MGQLSVDSALVDLVAFFAADFVAVFVAAAFGAAVEAGEDDLVDGVFEDEPFPDAFAVVALPDAAFADPPDGVFAAGVAAESAATALAARASREERESAARALPAAVCSPLALVAFPAAIRAFAALAAAARPVARVAFAPPTSVAPPSAAFTLSVRRLLRRAAALEWMAPTLAALSRADSASSNATPAASASPAWANVTALATKVLAADRRGCRTSWRLAACRTRFIACGVRAPVQVRDE
jgi:hypothetical protein